MQGEESVRFQNTICREVGIEAGIEREMQLRQADRVRR